MVFCLLRNQIILNKQCINKLVNQTQTQHDYCKILYNFSLILKYSSFETKVDHSNVFYKEKKVLGYPREYMFDLVKDVERYNEFVPWCLKSEILSENKRILLRSNDKLKNINKNFNLEVPDSFRARLEVGYLPLKESYISHVSYIKPKFVKTISVDTKFFEFISAEWKFYPYDHLTNAIIIKDELAKKTYECCMLEFMISFKMRSILHTTFSTLFLDSLTKKMVSAFVNRANQLYGPPKVKTKEIAIL